jgi:alpha-beta hydrolase superfamily lysophospholipase
MAKTGARGNRMRHKEGTFQGYQELELYTQCWLPGGKPRAALVLAHGFGDHSGRYSRVVEALVPRGYGVYAFDQRGNGRSPGQRGWVKEWKEYREDLRLFLDRVGREVGGLPLFLYGSSVGGLLVLEYAIRNPAGLAGVIASGPTLAPVGISPFLLWLGRVLSNVLPRFSLDARLDATAISRDPAVVAAYQNDPLVHNLGTPRLSTEIAAAMEWTHAHAGELKLPLFMLFGQADRIAPPHRNREFFENVASPDKEIHEYAGGYHETHNDIHSARVLEDIEEWLSRHLQAGQA